MLRGLFFGTALLCLACSPANKITPPTGSGGASGAGGAGGAGGATTSGQAGAGLDASATDSAPVGGMGGGTGGGAGTGGTDAGMAGAPGQPPNTDNSVLERNLHPSRDGHFVQPLLTQAKTASMTMETGFAATFTGDLLASPLYFEDGPGHKGLFFAATTSNTVYALDEMSGAVVWTTTIGPPATRAVVGCGDVHPIGIEATPVIDGKSRTLFVVGNMGPGSTTGFEIHALSVDDGKEREGWPVNLNNVRSGQLAFNSGAQNQRGALSLVAGILYVPFGGHNGDCGPYRGWVIAIDTANPTNIAGWATGGAGEAIWAAGGMVSDGNGVIAVTSNANGGGAVHQDSEEVVRITGMATVARNDANIYYPARWRALDDADDDFGASSPVLVDVPGSPAITYVVATTKDGHMYFLNSKNLGGMNGHLAEHIVADASHSVRTVHAAYTTAMGAHVALTVDDHAVCPTPASRGAGTVLMSVLVPPGTPTKPQTIWCVPLAGLTGTGGTHRTSAPIITTTDGRSESVVWVISGSALLGVDGDTGKVIYSGGNCTNVRHWTSPIAVKGRIIVGGQGHLCAWSPR